ANNVYLYSFYWRRAIEIARLRCDSDDERGLLNAEAPMEMSVKQAIEDAQEAKSRLDLKQIGALLQPTARDHMKNWLNGLVSSLQKYHILPAAQIKTLASSTVTRISTLIPSLSSSSR